MAEQDVEHPGDSARWKHRRRMAYASLGGVLGIAARAAFGDAIPEANEGILGAALWALAAVVGAYMGFAVADDVFRSKKPQS